MKCTAVCLSSAHQTQHPLYPDLWITTIQTPWINWIQSTILYLYNTWSQDQFIPWSVASAAFIQVDTCRLPPFCSIELKQNPIQSFYLIHAGSTDRISLHSHKIQSPSLISSVFNAHIMIHFTVGYICIDGPTNNCFTEEERTSFFLNNFVQIQECFGVFTSLVLNPKRLTFPPLYS